MITYDEKRLKGKTFKAVGSLCYRLIYLFVFVLFVNEFCVLAKLDIEDL